MPNLSQLLLLCVLGLCACSKRTPAASPPSEEAIEQSKGNRPLIAAGDLTRAPIHFEFAIYYLPTSEADPVAILDKLLASEYRGIQHVKKPPESIQGPCVLAKLLSDVPKSYPSPSTESLG